MRPFRFAELRPLGQLLATYLLLEGKDGLLLVDQHAAHERVLYERLRAGWLEGGAERQALLVPETLELEPGAAEVFEAARATVRALGFEVESFGGDAVVVRAVPALLEGRDPVALLRGLAEELRAADALGAEARPDARSLEAADRLFATAACHAARRAGEVLPAGEQAALLEALDAIPWAPTCPHGRPVAVPLSRGEIERRFGRA
jgi:DNA mismatch repair protein MutL